MKITILLSVAILAVSAGYSQTAEEFIAEGKSKAQNENYMKSIVDFSHAIELDPKNGEGYFYRGIAKRSLEDYRGAIVDFTKAIQLMPKENLGYKLAYYFRASSKKDLKDYKGAIIDYSTLIKIEPEATYYHERASCKVELEEYGSAIADCTAAIELQPDLALAYYLRGVIKDIIGLKESGCLDFSKAGELGLEIAYDAIRSLCN